MKTKLFCMMVLCAGLLVGCDKESEKPEIPVKPPVEQPDEPDKPVTPPSTDDIIKTKIGDLNMIVGSNNWTGIVYGNGKYVAVGYASNSPGYITTSNDAKTWTTPTRFGTIVNYPSIAFGNGKFVLIYGSRVYVSTDGNKFQEQIGILPGDFFNVYYLNGLFFALEYNGRENGVCVSSDGETWDVIKTQIPWGKMYSITYGNGTYYMTHYNNGTTLYSSVDGMTWKKLSSIPKSSLYKIAYGNGKLVAIGDAYYATTSVDGKLWTTPKELLIKGDIKFIAGKFIAVSTGSYGGNISTSTDGETWSVTEKIKDESGNNVTKKINGFYVMP